MAGVLLLDIRLTLGRVCFFLCTARNAKSPEIFDIARTQSGHGAQCHIGRGGAQVLAALDSSSDKASFYRR